MKLEKECHIYEIQHWTNMSKKFGVDLSMTIKDLLNEKEMNILNTIISKDKIKLTLEVEEPILDEEERKYLSGVIRPFRNKVIGVYKYNSVLSNYEEIAIDTCADYNCNHMTHLPPFKKGTMYKNLELNKEYSLKDLDL